MGADIVQTKFEQIEELRQVMHDQVDRLIQWMIDGESKGFPNGYYGFDENGYEPIHKCEAGCGKGLYRGYISFVRDDMVSEAK